MAEPFQLSNMSSASRGRTLNWAAERVSIPRDSPARDAAVMLLDLVTACTEVAQSSIDDHWLRALCMAALYGPEEPARAHTASLASLPSAKYQRRAVGPEPPWYCEDPATCEGPCGECWAEVK